MNKKFYILRDISENNDHNVDEICHIYNITHRELKKYLSDLKESDKYLDFDEGETYENISKNNLTDGGRQYLNENKVEKAVILASGLGSRMGDLTTNTSKCLLEVKGDILIERLITQLKEKGITDIVVLVGYMKEKFLYLAEKYGVKLVENPEYDTKNTIASFYHLINEIKNKNVYIVVGDIYLEKNIFNSFETEPYYLGPWLDDCTGEWIYNYDESGKVSGVVLDGFYDYFLGGFSFHTKHFINELIKLVKEKYHEIGTDKLYWEEVLVYNFDKLPDFFVRKIPSGILYEFDTKQDLDRIKNETIVLKDKLTSILNLSNDKRISIDKIGDGLNNHTYIANVDDKKYVVRIAGDTTGVFVDRKKEKEVYEILNKYDISDRVVYFDETTGLKISEYLEKTHDENKLTDEEAIIAFKKLHSLNIKTDKNIDITKVLENYISIMKKHKINFIYDDIIGFNEVLNRCEVITKYINTFERPKVLCHGDAGNANVISTTRGVKIIDFEFSGVADPISDVALYAVYSGLSIEQSVKLFEAYKNIKVENDDILELEKNSHNELVKLLVSYMAIDSIACVIWDIITATITGRYLKNYSRNRIEVFKNCCSLLTI